jgi:hypothetical protein
LIAEDHFLRKRAGPSTSRPPTASMALDTELNTGQARQKVSFDGSKAKTAL